MEVIKSNEITKRKKTHCKGKQNENVLHISSLLEDVFSNLKYTDQVDQEVENHQIINEIKNENTDREIIFEHLKTNIVGAKDSHELASKMYENVLKMKHLKVIEAAVPKGILSQGYSVALYDVRIAGYGPDESVYQKHKWIRENVTRGMTFMRISGKEKLFDFAVYANKKFTGGVGDEDECQPESNDVWREFCLQKPEEATKVICIEKLNGEAGHFTVRSIGGEFYIIAGSKNVHLLFKDYMDIELYTDSRFQVAKTVARSVLNTFHRMSETHVLSLKQLLNATKMTVVCEVLQPEYQHIVNLSYLKEASINFLMLCSVAKQKMESFTAVPPHLGLEIAKTFGLPVPKYFSISVDQVPETVVRIRGMTDVEGYVLYYLKGNETIGLAKVKTAWYVMLRALREKVDHGFNSKKQKNNLTQDKIKATHKRFGQIQKWIKFTDDYRNHWEVLAKAFFHWIEEGIKKNRICSSNIRPKFPLLWAKFLTDTKRTDMFHFEAT